MNKDYLKNITKEDRALMLEKAKAKREEKKKAGESLRQNYADENYHRNLARDVGFRMPASYISNQEVKYLKRLMKHLGIDIKEYLEDAGVKTLKQLVDMNPENTAVEELGTALEWYFDKTEEYK